MRLTKITLKYYFYVHLLQLQELKEKQLPLIIIYFKKNFLIAKYCVQFLDLVLMQHLQKFYLVLLQVIEKKKYHQYVLVLYQVVGL